MLKKHFLLSMLKTVLLLNIFIETVIHFLGIFWWIERSKENNLFEIVIFCDIINIFTVSFSQLNASLLIEFLKKKI